MADDHTQGVGDDDLIAAAVGELEGVERERAVRLVGEQDAVFYPFIYQGGAAGVGDGQCEALASSQHAARRLGDDDGSTRRVGRGGAS